MNNILDKYIGWFKIPMYISLFGNLEIAILDLLKYLKTLQQLRLKFIDFIKMTRYISIKIPSITELKHHIDIMLGDQHII